MRERIWRTGSAASRNPAEVAAEAGLAPAELAKIDAAARVVTSLDRTVDESGETRLGDLLPDAATDVGEQVVMALGHEALRRAVRALPEPEREVIRRRFGLDGDPAPETHRAIAARLGVPPAKVRAIERRALADLAQAREIQELPAA